ncbi:arylamine N-acetyltransferase [Massilia sp. TS11]|uniref:arylamine N-acetyltransferase family protein n=1 Tax=Massilia sp. TS11 TaxID=2908003 RepID=UPI001EDC32BF|nr:arylamine N-acetyltransferase [Massilia sp. TS11]MCG2583811.1 arylamine N-acetyltransferase [Massilia sp. TS11]
MPEPDLAGLQRLMQAQLRAIAFENFDVLAGRPISREPQALFDKLLAQGRGGYCFELNGLLALALEAAGFAVTRRIGRVCYGRPGPGPQSHKLISVALVGCDWLVDAGFGGPGLLAPLPCAPHATADQDGARVRLLPLADGDLLLQRLIDGAWVDIFQILRQPPQDIDYDVANHFCATYPRSPFRQRVLAQLHVADGTWEADGAGLVLRDAQRQALRRVDWDGPDAVQASCAELLRLDLPPAVAQAVWDRLPP